MLWPTRGARGWQQNADLPTFVPLVASAPVHLITSLIRATIAPTEFMQALADSITLGTGYPDSWVIPTATDGDPTALLPNPVPPARLPPITQVPPLIDWVSPDALADSARLYRYQPLGRLPLRGLLPTAPLHG